MSAIVTATTIEKRILLLRGQKVMLDSDLAELYRVEAKVLIQAVKRNIARFPSDFMFQLENQEVASLRSQIVTLKTGRGQHRKYPYYAFTEQGIAMLSSVLHSERAIQVNIEIMRAFVKLRELIASHKDLARKLVELEKTYDARFRVVFDAIRQLMEPPIASRRRIGFDLKGSRGSAAVELAVVVPIAAFLLIVIVQFAALFTQAVHDVGVASAAASQAIRDWDAVNRASGFRRPCLEEMPTQAFRSENTPVAVGVGSWRRSIDVSQEVRLVAGTVCDR